jgi:hypothetical protein
VLNRFCGFMLRKIQRGVLAEAQVTIQVLVGAAICRSAPIEVLRWRTLTRDGKTRAVNRYAAGMLADKKTSAE